MMGFRLKILQKRDRALICHHIGRINKTLLLYQFCALWLF
jgi:hypothetical protein